MSVQRKRFPIERDMVEAVMNAEGEAAVELLQTIHSCVSHVTPGGGYE